VTQRLAAELAKQGTVIVSGLALGVDSIAHQAALDAGGHTVAVLPSSIEEIYPASHRGLAERIVQQGGALISEYPKGTPVMKHNFIARNRLIAGLADGLIVTEAALKSGSLHTARFALEQGIDVFAVPGNITSPTSEGTNNLIKSGAMPLTDVSDVLSRLNIEPVNVALPLGDTEQEQAILDQLAAGISDGNELQQASGLAIELFGQTLTMLEINGKIRALGNNNWSL
jgi:DNA processing protein